MKSKSRLKISRIFLLFFTFFISIGAFFGSLMMFIDPSGKIMGMDALLPYFQVLPFADILFQNFIFSGISLLIVNGISNLIASIFILKNKKCGYILGTIFGFTLMAWITIQFCIFPMNFMDIAYFIFGFLQFVIGGICLVFYAQENYHFDEKDYPDIQKDHSVLVIYFSRLNYTKSIAYEIANNNQCDIEGITTNEKTDNTLGFLWCGRFGMHQWAMDINPIKANLDSYQKIIIVTPIWVFRMCSPTRGFIKNNLETLKNKDIEVVFNHFNPWLPKKAITEITDQLPVSKVISYQTNYGHKHIKSQPLGK